MEADCPLCNLPKGTKVLIEAEYTQGLLSAVDIVGQMGAEKVDLMAVMIHMADHADSLEEEVERKREFMGEKPEVQKTEADAEFELTEEYVEEPLPTVSLDSDHLEQLNSMLTLLKEKLYAIAKSKDIRSLGLITKETRETLREIERVKKSTRLSLADRTDALLEEHNEMNRFLMFNLCTECGPKYQAFLRGEFETFAVDAHGKDGTNSRADVVDSGTVE
jgi:hypothetical protein